MPAAAVVPSVDPISPDRHLSPMRTFSTTLALASLLPGILLGQARYSLALGATAGTRLVSDRIFQEIEVTQGIAPTVTIGASLPVSARERAGVEIALGFGKTRIRESGFPTADGPGFRTLAITGGVQGPVWGPVGYRFGAGLLKYLPDKEGIFRRGGPLLLILSGGTDIRLPVGGPVGFAARLRYDYQRFNTDELQSTGFGRTQDVHRVGVGLAIEYQRR